MNSRRVHGRRRAASCGSCLCLWVGLALGSMVTTAGAEKRPSLPLSLSEAALENDVAEELCRALRDTQHGTKKERLDRIQKVIDRALMKLDLPIIFPDMAQRVHLLDADIAPPTGQFDPMYWTITIDSQLLRAGPLSPEEMTEIVAALYHELRHVEQYYVMVCWCIDSGQELTLIHLPLARAVVWHAQYEARRRVEGKRARLAAWWLTQRTSPELRRRHDAFLDASMGVHQAKAERQRRAEALAKARQRKAPRKERNHLAAALQQAEQDLKAQSLAFRHALADYRKLPLETDVRKVLGRLTPCPKV